MIRQKVSDFTTPEDLLKHEGRLQKRLLKMGFKVNATRKEPCSPDGKKIIYLKDKPTMPRTYQIICIDTGEVAAGSNFELTLEDVEHFWEQKVSEQAVERRKQQQAAQRAEAWNTQSPQQDDCLTEQDKQFLERLRQKYSWN